MDTVTPQPDREPTGKPLREALQDAIQALIDGIRHDINTGDDSQTNAAAKEIGRLLPKIPLVYLDD